MLVNTSDNDEGVSGAEMRRLTQTFDKTIKMRYDIQVYNYTLLARAIGMFLE
jgi:hypothetical protein